MKIDVYFNNNKNFVDINPVYYNLNMSKPGMADNRMNINEPEVLIPKIIKKLKQGKVYMEGGSDTRDNETSAGYQKIYHEDGMFIYETEGYHGFGGRLEKDYEEFRKMDTDEFTDFLKNYPLLLGSVINYFKLDRE